MWILGLLLMVVLPLFMTSVFCWMESSIGGSVRLKFEKFKESYEANPCRWDIKETRVYMRREGGYESISINFSYLDYYRYCFWKAKKDIHAEEEIELNTLNEINDIIKSDIKNCSKGIVKVNL